MIERLLDRCFHSRIIINCEHQPYLHRWYLFRRQRFAIFLHKFVRSDEDRALHDHPWGFIVLPIWRGYIEHTDGGCQRRVWPLIGTRYRPATFRHRVELIDGQPAWSIFIRFKYLRSWGFWPGHFVHWRKWWNDLCED
jgi:hypothetical protein